MADDTGPVRKIDDASYGTPPENPVERRILGTKRWFLLDANRTVVAGLLLCASFVVIVLVGSYGPVSPRSFLTAGVSPGSALVELLKTIVSVVVIVLSINQLVLSPGLGPVGDQRERYEQSIELRQRVEDRTGTSVSPSSPAAFLGVLLAEIVDRADRVAEAASRHGDEALQERTREFASGIGEEATAVRELLSSGQFGEFEVISAALRFAISEKVRVLRGMERAGDRSLPEPVSEEFDELSALLELFTVAREYFKTIYIREEYVSLSTGLLYTGLPAIILTYCAAQIYSPSVFPGETAGFDTQLLFVAAAVSVSLAPLALLVSYVFRLAALSRSTLFVGPFDARESETDPGDSPDRGR